MSFGPLISPESLRAAQGPLRLLDARPGPEGYAAGHLAGAHHADLNRWLSTAAEPGFDPSRGGRHPLPPPSTWAATLGRWAIGPDTPVVAYDDVSGGNGACRLWWMLRAFGHAQVAVLDGGLAAAQAAGLALTTQEPPPPEPLPPTRRTTGAGPPWTSSPSSAFCRIQTGRCWTSGAASVGGARPNPSIRFQADSQAP